MPVVGTFEKQSHEEIVITVDFGEVMAAGESIDTGTVTVTTKGATTDHTSTMAGTPAVSGDTLACLIKGGTTGNQYNASYRVVTDASPVQKFEADVTIKVVDVG